MSGESAEATGGDTSEEIMEATYRALCEHGYASLTMQDIADESDKSTAALHYHYDTKEGLLLAFLDHLYERFTEKYGAVEGDDAVERLVGFVDGILRQSNLEDPERFQTALLEIRAQAPYDREYRERLAKFDAFVTGRVEEFVADGIAEGTIRADVDPGDTAAFVATLIDGVNTRRTTIGDTGGGTRRTFVAYVREHLVAPGADVRIDDEPAGSGPESDASAAPGDDEETTPDSTDGGAGA
jgi:AcrR family transcriptional regulator